jgi:geranylgeranyl pyrophosphate synthase
VTTTPATPFEEVLDAAGEPVRTALAAVEQRLVDIAVSHGPPLAGAARETLAAGGKRLRPLLVLVCGGGAAADDRSSTALVRAAAAVELVHMATLVHDDVVDAAPERRGRPTVYARSGRSHAIATGDFLFSRAFALLERSGDREQVRVLASACLDLARGELVQREDAFAREVGVERYLLRCRLKTASLFSAACRLGALAAGADARQVEALGRFGTGVGLAFQLFDDALDVIGTREATGKERGTDLLDGTTTLPLILARERDRELAALELRSLRSREEAERVSDRIAASGAIELTSERARALVADAKTELAGDVDAHTASLLRLVADRVVDRYA